MQPMLAAMLVAAACATSSDADSVQPPNLIDAAVRITAEDGGTGTGCVYSTTPGYAFVLTAGHVATSQGVAVEFWRGGHLGLPIRGEVIWSGGARCDAAIVAVELARLKGYVPPAIPLAPRAQFVADGQMVQSVGCAAGAWATEFQGHATGYEMGDGLQFVPPPANGRSGSALVADGRVIGVIVARSDERQIGIAVPIQEVYAAYEANKASRAAAPQGPSLVQCPGGVCPVGPQPQPYYLSPYRQQQQGQMQQFNGKLGQQDQRLGQLESRPFPTLPEQQHANPLAEQMRSDIVTQKQLSDARDELLRANQANVERIDRLTANVNDVQQGLRGVQGDFARVQQVGDALAKDFPEVRRAIDEARASSAAAGQLATNARAAAEESGRVAGDAVRAADETKKEQSTLVERIHQRIEDRVDALKPYIWIAVALAVAAVAFLLIRRDVRQHVETGDPLAIQKLAAKTPWQWDDSLADRIADRMASAYGRFHPAAAPPPATPIVVAAPAPQAAAVDPAAVAAATAAAIAAQAAQQKP